MPNEPKKVTLALGAIIKCSYRKRESKVLGRYFPKQIFLTMIVLAQTPKQKCTAWSRMQGLAAEWDEGTSAFLLLEGSALLLILSPESLLIQENQSHAKNRDTDVSHQGPQHYIWHFFSECPNNCKDAMLLTILRILLRTWTEIRYTSLPKPKSGLCCLSGWCFLWEVNSHFQNGILEVRCQVQ